MSAIPKPAPPEPIFADWIGSVELPEYLVETTGGAFVYRVERYGQHIRSLQHLQKFSSTRWPDLLGSISIKRLWAAWLEHLECRSEK